LLGGPDAVRGGARGQAGGRRAAAPLRPRGAHGRRTATLRGAAACRVLSDDDLRGPAVRASDERTGAPGRALAAIATNVEQIARPPDAAVSRDCRPARRPA